MRVYVSDLEEKKIQLSLEPETFASMRCDLHPLCLKLNILNNDRLLPLSKTISQPRRADDICYFLETLIMD